MKKFNARESENQHSKKTNQKMKIIGHIPVEISSSDSKNWLCIEVQKGSWLSGGETEIHCIYFLYEAKFKKVHESSTWKTIEQCEKDLKFKKTTSIHFTQLNPAKAFT